MEFLFGSDRVTVNVRDWSALQTVIRRKLRSGDGFSLATINLDHLVKLPRDDAFRAAYARHDLVTADGWPIVWLSRLAGRRVSLLPGSELLVPMILLAADEHVNIAFVGSSEMALEDATRAIAALSDTARIVTAISPPFGFEPDGVEAAEIIERLRAADVGLCILALSAPKQEIFSAFAHRVAPEIGFAGFGAGLDFLGGHQRRAPALVRKVGMEWLWRALSSPLRLGPRYLRCLMILPGQVIAALRLRRAR